MSNNIDTLEEIYSDSDITRQNSLIVPLHLEFVSLKNMLQHREIYMPGMRNMSDDVKTPKMHHHTYIEFMFILSGEISQRVEKSLFKYQKGNICLLNRSVSHCEVVDANTECEVAYLCLSCDYLKTMFENNILYGGSDLLHWEGGEIYKFLKQSATTSRNPLREYFDIYPTINSEGQNKILDILHIISRELLRQSSGSNYIIYASIIQLIDLIEDSLDFNFSRKKLDTSTEDFILSRVISYLTENKGRVSYEELSTRLNYSASYVNQIVKKHVGKSILQLGKEYCLEEAKRLLRETDMSVRNIMTRLDYSNSSYFYRIFQEQTGLSPVEYRDKHHTHPSGKKRG